MKQSIDHTVLTRPRIEWIDCAKGLGILLVILGHTWGIPHWLYCLIYSFHMPLFFLLSGLTYKYDPDIRIGKYACKIAKSYLLPYIILAFANLMLQTLWLFYVGAFDVGIIGKYLLGILYCYANTDWMPNCSPLWFLCAIFFVKLWVFFVHRLTRSNKWAITIVVTIGGFIAWLASTLEFHRLPWSLLPALVGSVFFWVGHCLGKNNNFLHRGWTPLTLIAIVLALVLSPWIADNVPGMNQNYYDNVFLFLISGFGFSFLCIILSVQLKNSRFLSSFLGRNTVVLMGFNYFARTIAIEFYYLIPYVRNHIIHPLVSFVLTTLVLICITWTYNQTIQFRRRTANAN